MHHARLKSGVGLQALFAEVVSFPAPSRVSFFFCSVYHLGHIKEKKTLKPRCESAAPDAEQAAIKGLLRAGVVARLTNSGKQRAWEEEEVKETKPEQSKNRSMVQVRSAGGGLDCLKEPLEGDSAASTSLGLVVAAAGMGDLREAWACAARRGTGYADGPGRFSSCDCANPHQPSPIAT